MLPNQRSRTPTIFSIYMLDVICCSLGCVILLWQANYQKLQESEESNVASNQEIVNLKLDKESRLTLILPHGRPRPDQEERTQSRPGT